jgi:photosystem II stability/assembly factor-like uncharacterized protein
MMETLHRYPGAQPFRDDEFSRRTFFGREPASVALTDQILANRLVIVYAKSGLGKTSLLNAGVAPRLREVSNLPLFVRVNDTQRGAVFSVIEGVAAEAERQQVEYVQGDSSSLWSFFKTVEFWRGDLLLTPVLILDQFEELFTLQSQEQREKFLSELGYVVRGIPPPSQTQVTSSVSDSPPSIRVVLSLREDFLGLLEEASDHIPEIMDHRYRVAPLSYEMASKAITGPAAVEHTDVATRAFRLEPEFVTSILDYLTRSTAGARGPAGRHVEPFHLQLICQRIETIAAFKQQGSDGAVVLSFKDLGGEAALAETLESFYTNSIRSLPGRRVRGAVRILCEQFLISPEGRRLSVEERELCRQLKLPREMLDRLVERRLLRTDRRSESTYYELSHDALVQPVLASRRTQALVVGWANVLAGAIVSGAAILVSLACVYTEVRDTKKTASDYIAAAFVIAMMIVIAALGIVWLRSGLRRRNRYRRHAAGEDTAPLPPLRHRILGWFMLVTGPILFTLWGVLGLFGLSVYGIGVFTRGRVPTWPLWLRGIVHEAWQLLHDHPLMETQWTVVEFSAIVLLGWLMFRQGARKVWPYKLVGRSKTSSIPGVDQPPSFVLASVKVLLGSVALLVAALGFFTLRTCSSAWHRSIPYWLSWAMISYRLSDACQIIYQKSLDFNGISFALFFFAAFVFSIVLLRAGALDIRAAFRHRQLGLTPREHRRAMVAAVCGVLIAVSLLLWTHPGSRPVKSTGEIQNQQARAATFNLESSTQSSGWAVGNEAAILHTEDGGNTWKSQNNGTGWFYSVTAPTRRLAWAVGGGGSIWHTDDSGSTWRVQSSGTKASLSVVAFAGAQLGWVVGDKGTILHTEDAGSTWKAQNSGTRKMLRSIALATPQSIWAVGDDGTILHTEDGGSIWKPQKSGTDANLDYVAFVTPRSGWAAGSDGAIVHTEDGGDTWRLQTSGTVRDLTGIAFVTPQSGWVVGDKGIILHTEDGGNTWKFQTSGVRAAMSEVAFVSPQSGWAAGHGGIILHTEDGGETWTPQNGGIRADLQSVTFVKPYGVIGVVLKTAVNQAKTRTPAINGGVIVLQVIPGGPADKAGLKAGDTVISVNGKQVKTSDEMVAAIVVLKPGTRTTLTCVHNGKQNVVTVMIGDGSKL